MIDKHIITTRNIAGVADYYEAEDDYYASEGESQGWQGKGAAALGLSGPVDSYAFKELLAGRIHGVQLRTSTRLDSKQRLAYDFTIKAPKSVAMQGLVRGDARIIAAHDRAVTKTIEHIEGYAAARLKSDRKSHIEQTGNLVVAKFRHETSREQDPLLHTHAVIVALTQRADGEWRALKNDELFKRIRQFDAVYMAELAIGLREAGYALRQEPNGHFELAHISRAQILAFSKRSAQIDDALAARGLTRDTASAVARRSAALATRADKVIRDRAELQREWQDRAREYGVDFSPDAIAKAAKRERLVDPQDLATLPAEASADRSVGFAIKHLTERQAIVERDALAHAALQHGIGQLRIADIRDSIERFVERGKLIAGPTVYASALNPKTAARTADAWAREIAGNIPLDVARTHVSHAIKVGRLVAAQPRYTTAKAMQMETAILRMERTGRGAVAPAMDVAEVRRLAAGRGLTTGQRAALTLSLTTANRIVGVQGGAGTGKSYVLEPTIAALKAKGYNVKALAPYTTQARALAELGTKAQTVASFLAAKDKGLDDRSVLFVDEAATVPTRQMEHLLREVEKAGARVILVGDVAQTVAIEAGRPFDQLQHAGMALAVMDENQRQTDPELRRAVELAAAGRAADSLAHIAHLQEVPGATQRRGLLAQTYAGLSPAERERTIILSATNEARREINAGVRSLLGLVGKGREYELLRRRDTTQAQREYAKYYYVGDVIQPERSDADTGLERGNLYRIVATGAGKRMTVSPVGAPQSQIQIRLSPKLPLSVYEPTKGEIAPGDKVRITRNEASLNLANGDRFTVQSISPDSITLHDGKRQVVIAADTALHLDHAYVTTVHASQGVTADRALLDADTLTRLLDQRLHLVGLSRAREEVHMLTDSLARLPEAVQRVNVKHAALDLQEIHH